MFQPAEIAPKEIEIAPKIPKSRKSQNRPHNA